MKPGPYLFQPREQEQPLLYSMVQNNGKGIRSRFFTLGGTNALSFCPLIIPVSQARDFGTFFPLVLQTNKTPLSGRIEFRWPDNSVGGMKTVNAADDLRTLASIGVSSITYYP